MKTLKTFLRDERVTKEAETSFKEIDVLFKKNKEMKRNKYPRFSIERL